MILPGAIVVLNSGGPAMTVTGHVKRTKGADQKGYFISHICEWFEDGEVGRSEFHEESLTLIAGGKSEEDT